MTDHLVVWLDPDKSEEDWDHSTFPHPLITCDWDKDDNLVHVEVLGPIAQAAIGLVETLVSHAPATIYGDGGGGRDSDEHG